MRRKMVSGLCILALFCAAVLVMAACAKKKIPVTPPPSAESGTGPTVGETETAPGYEMGETAEVRQQRLADLEKGAQEASGAMNAKIYFEYDSSDLSADARETLKEIADMMNSNPSWSLDISGHCDERGTIEYNLALGERRARAAKKFLVSLGISADRISTISYGEERPVDPRSTEEAWAKNRRCEFSFIR